MGKVYCDRQLINIVLIFRVFFDPIVPDLKIFKRFQLLFLFPFKRTGLENIRSTGKNPHF